MLENEIFGTAIEDSVPHPTSPNDFLVKVAVHGPSPISRAIPQFAIHQRLLAEAENRCIYSSIRPSLTHFLDRIRQE